MLSVERTMCAGGLRTNEAAEPALPCEGYEGFEVDAGYFGAGESLARVLERQTGAGRAAMLEAAWSLREASKIVITAIGASLHSAYPLHYALAGRGMNCSIVEIAELLALPGTDLRGRGGGDFFAVGGIDRGCEVVGEVEGCGVARDCGNE